MHFVGIAGYVVAAALYVDTHPMLAFVAVMLLAWLAALAYLKRRLVLNEGPWNEPIALNLSFTVFPMMVIALSVFGPLYASWALLP